MRSAVLALLAASSGLAAGCASDDPAAPVPASTVRDSAGVRIVENARPAWGEGEAWTVEPEPALVLGPDVDGGGHLFGAGVARFLADGRIAVGNSGERHVLIYDREGTLLARGGGPGDGPGELDALYRMERCGGDTLAIIGVHRLTLFDGNAGLVRTARVSGELAERRANLSGMSTDCSRALLVSSVYSAASDPDADHGTRNVLFWTSLDGASVDTVAAPQARQDVPRTFPWGTGWYPLPFGWRTVTEPRGDDVLVLRTDRPELRVLAEDGSVREIVRWTADSDPVTSADVNEASEALAAILAQEPEEDPARYPTPEETGWAEFKPLTSAVEVDTEGNAWLRRYDGYQLLYATNAEWWVFDPDGRWLGTVTVPEGLEVLDVSDGLVLARHRDELDVETLRVHRLRKPGRGGAARPINERPEEKK